MTKLDELLEYIDRDDYEHACATLGLEPLSDDEVLLMAETGYERFYNLHAAGGSTAEKAALATHIRRGYSIIHGAEEAELDPLASLSPDEVREAILWAIDMLPAYWRWSEAQDRVRSGD